MPKQKLVRLDQKNLEEIQRILLNLTKRLKEIGQKSEAIHLEEIRKRLNKV